MSMDSIVVCERKLNETIFQNQVVCHRIFKKMSAKDLFFTSSHLLFIYSLPFNELSEIRKFKLKQILSIIFSFFKLTQLCLSRSTSFHVQVLKEKTISSSETFFISVKYITVFTAVRYYKIKQKS